MANENMTMSPAGMAALRRREQAVLHYYNDVANNCTFGVGTLVHHGPCTEDELRRPVTNAQIDAQLAARVRTAEAVVPQHVTRHVLTQGQFDALVSFVFNVGAAGARTTLEAADQGGDVAGHMNRHVFVHPRDARGHRRRPIRVPGLVHRRHEEAAPFQGQQNRR